MGRLSSDAGAVVLRDVSSMAHTVSESGRATAKRAFSRPAARDGGIDPGFRLPARSGFLPASSRTARAGGGWDARPCGVTGALAPATASEQEVRGVELAPGEALEVDCAAPEGCEVDVDAGPFIPGSMHGPGHPAWTGCRGPSE